MDVTDGFIGIEIRSLSIYRQVIEDNLLQLL